MNSWQRKRNRLNHDWLKNRFIIQLSALRNMATSKDYSHEILQRECREVLRQWCERGSEIKDLIEGFEYEESPKALFESPPLSNCDAETKAWLPAFVHERWLTTQPVDLWVKDTHDALALTDQSASKLESGMMRGDPVFTSLSWLLKEFLERASALSKAISCFPTRQLI